MGMGSSGSRGYRNPRVLTLRVCVIIVPSLPSLLPVSTPRAVARSGGWGCYCGGGGRVVPLLCYSVAARGFSLLPLPRFIPVEAPVAQRQAIACRMAHRGCAYGT
jgi:hypothetical protein